MPPTKIKAQSAKAIQSLIALACWAVVIEKAESKKKDLNLKLQLYYHGDPLDPDVRSKVDMLLEGEGRFAPLWAGDVIAPIFGPLLAGLTKKQLRAAGVLTAKTLSKPDNKLGNNKETTVDDDEQNNS